MNIETVVAALRHPHALAVLLHAGEPAMLLSESGHAPISASELTAAEVDTLLASIVPGTVMGTLNDRGAADHRWTCALLDGADVAVTAIRAGADLWVELRRTARESASEGSSVEGSRHLAPVDHREDVPFEAWIRAAHDAGAESLLVTAGAKPTAKSQGILRPLCDEAIDARRLQRYLVKLTEVLAHEGAVERDGAFEWPVPGIGIVRCRMMADRRGPGALFDLCRTATTVADVRIPGVLREALADGDGLIVVAGRTPRDRAALAHAMIDFVNRERPVHIICLEQAPTVLHEHQRGLVSQRAIPDASGREWPRALDQAESESPDVVLVDGPLSPDTFERVVHWASDSRLVILTVPEPSTVAALRTLAAVRGPDRQADTSRRLADVVAAATSLISGPRRGGGRICACETLPGTVTVRSLLAEQAFDRLTLVLDRGDEGARSIVMAVADLVIAGEIGLNAALRAVPDPAALLTVVRRVQRAGADVEHPAESLDLTSLLEAAGTRR